MHDLLWQHYSNLIIVLRSTTTEREKATLLWEISVALLVLKNTSFVWKTNCVEKLFECVEKHI